jgi:uroporphyrin-III C-methyltransferase/precorrin-2 dehydrogenase/sirohydrochlorin ferrochelatase
MARGAGHQSARLVKDALAAGHTDPQGSIALVGAGPGAPDLLTLRALRLLQEADVIFHDRLVDPAVLDLARRDAERVFVGKAVGACAWPQDRINALIVAEARRGRRVVRLKSGDPGIFGRATEELDAARAAGIPVEIVPGVTAASAAAAALGRPLTERGETGALVIATATRRPGEPAPELAAHLRPGTTLAVYMGAQAAEALGRTMIAAGLPGGIEVEIVTAASTAAERVRRTSLAALAEGHIGPVAAPALILMRHPKASAARSDGRPDPACGATLAVAPRPSPGRAVLTGAKVRPLPSRIASRTVSAWRRSTAPST